MIYSPAIALLTGVLLAAGLVWVFLPDRGLLARYRRNRELTDRVLGEDALKYLAVQGPEGDITVQAIAGSLEVPLNRAVAVVEDLLHRGLIEKAQYRFFLTESGREAARSLIRAHRLWEVYLSRKTGYAPAEWHARADAREHLLSEDAVQDLSRELGHPVFDPDGDPIPGTGVEPDGTPREDLRAPGEPLSRIEAGRWVRVDHVEDEPPAVYAALTEQGVYPGLELEVTDTGPGPVHVRIRGEERELSALEVENVTVSPVEAVEEAAGTMALCDAEVGTPVVVEELAGTVRGAARRRLLDLGIVRGTVVVAEMRGPGGEPTAYRVRGSLIALRSSQAQHIRVSQRVKEAV